MSARFGTAPEIWNWAMWLTARLSPSGVNLLLCLSGLAGLCCRSALLWTRTACSTAPGAWYESCRHRMTLRAWDDLSLWTRARVAVSGQVRPVIVVGTFRRLPGGPQQVQVAGVVGRPMGATRRQVRRRKGAQSDANLLASSELIHSRACSGPPAQLLKIAGQHGPGQQCLECQTPISVPSLVCVENSKPPHTSTLRFHTPQVAMLVEVELDNGQVSVYGNTHFLYQFCHMGKTPDHTGHGGLCVLPLR